MEEIYGATADALAAFADLLEPPTFYSPQETEKGFRDEAWRTLKELKRRLRRWDYYLPRGGASEWREFMCTLEQALGSESMAKMLKNSPEFANAKSKLEVEVESAIDKLEALHSKLAEHLKELLEM